MQGRLQLNLPALILDADEVELVEMLAKVELPHGAGGEGPAIVAPDEAGGRVDVPGEARDGGLVRVELAGLVLQVVVGQHDAAIWWSNNKSVSLSLV